MEEELAMNELRDLSTVLVQVANHLVRYTEGSKALTDYLEAHRDFPEFRVLSSSMERYRGNESALQPLLDQADDIELVIAYGEGLVPRDVAAERYNYTDEFEMGPILSCYPTIERYAERGELLDEILHFEPHPDTRNRGIAGYVLPDGSERIFDEMLFTGEDH